MEALPMTQSYGPQTALSQEIDSQKYRLEGESFEESIRRLTKIVGHKDRDATFDMLANQRFLPAGRIRNAIGSGKTVTAFNCYVMKDIPDSLEGIMDILKEGALTMKMGGGTGFNFSKIRPKDDLIESVKSRASGPVSYMHIYNSMCATIKSAGERRGAMMFVVRVDHPDIEEYIEVKTQPGVLTNANLSIAVTDEFMNAVEYGLQFPLSFNGKVYKYVDARTLWDKIMKATWDWAEPGILFIDKINRENNLWYCETITATNPCAEQPLPANGACLLGSFNLVKYIKGFDGQKFFDNQTFAKDITLAVNFLDSVVDSTIYPLPDQEQEALNKRRMGLGVTGVANALSALGLEYGSDAFLVELDRILESLKIIAYTSSVRLAQKYGAFPKFDAELYGRSEFVKKLPVGLQTLIKTYGIRNSHLISIAPTGTISLCADNISSGIEPVFTHEYDRTIKTNEGEVVETVQDYAFREWGIKGKTALELTPDEHIKVLAIAQKHCDSAVSKTVNIGDDVTYEQFKDVYRSAFLAGAKGCTTFRAAGKRLGILVAKSESTSHAELIEEDLAELTGQACSFDPDTGRKTCE
jgi:ribonucleoside-diphosphate reductase alpha chain